VPGQWEGSPDPNEHDILTGSNADGTLADNCSDWTSDTGTVTVGHSDGLGPGGSDAENYRPWNSVHTSQCGNLEATGGAGRLYCFASD
jgi:hypothetical protein